MFFFLFFLDFLFPYVYKYNNINIKSDKLFNMIINHWLKVKGVCAKTKANKVCKMRKL